MRTTPDWRGMHGLALAMTLALMVRLVLSALSYGSDDLFTWERFGRLVAAKGLFAAYDENDLFNHPPLAGYLAAGCVWLADLLGLRFGAVFKLPVILANVGAVALVWRRRPLATGMLLLLALNPADVLVSAYHGNTDCLCAALCLLAVSFQQRGAPALAGLALAAAINVKLIPVLLIAPLLLILSRREALRFAAGLGVGLLPFLPALPHESFVQNVLDYQPRQIGWGISILMLSWADEGVRAACHAYRSAARFVILALAAGLGLAACRARFRDPYALAALTFSLFLVLVPGFGVQYVVYPIAFLFAWRPRVALEYAWLAGLFAACLYLAYWDGRIPASSIFHGKVGMGPYLVGLFPWYVLVRFLVAEAWRATRPARRGA
jgi:hypothetical protein